MSVRFNESTLMTMENSVFWDVKTYRLLETYQRLGGTFYFKDGDCKFS